MDSSEFKEGRSPWDEPWPGEKILRMGNRLPTVNLSEDRDYSGSDLLLVHDPEGMILASSLVGDMTSDEDNSYDIKKVVDDVYLQLGKRGLEKYSVDIVKINKEKAKSLGGVEVDLGYLTGGRDSFDYRTFEE